MKTTMMNLLKSYVRWLFLGFIFFFLMDLIFEHEMNVLGNLKLALIVAVLDAIISEGMRRREQLEQD